MKKTVNQIYEGRKEEFGVFLRRQRKRGGVSLEALAEGLCSFGELARIERGERIAGKPLRDRLLQRLGISPGCYENFLFGEDYERWEKRQKLLYAVSRKDLESADKLLGEYRKQYEADPEKTVIWRLERQFSLSMEAQILRIKGTASGQESKDWEGEVAKRFREALEMTALASGSVRGKLYSAQEWYLLLESLHYGRAEDREARYREILCEAKEPRFDPVSQAEIYSKTAYYLCRDGLENGTWGLRERAEALTWCESAIDRLRRVGRVYYLWELLQQWEVLLRGEAKMQRMWGMDKKAEEAEDRIQESREWAEALEAMYEEFGVPKETEDFCWLYVETEPYQIGKVIRTRREMLGLTRKKLCEGICSEKSLYRLEREGKKMQDECVRALMSKLNLSAEYCRTELITSNPDAVEVMDKLRGAIRNYENEQAKWLLNRLEGLISMEIPSNCQVWQRCQALIELHKGSICRDQFIDRIREALACTLDYKKAMKSINKYLTNEEISCIQNMVIWKQEMDEEKKIQIDMLEKQYEMYEEKGQIGCFISMYEMVMDCVASEWGNMGEYDKSDQISKKLIMESLYLRRLYGVHGGIYNMVWNYKQRQKKGIPFLKQRDVEKDLNHCVILSKLCQETVHENFYKEKLAIQKKQPKN